jgi:hypothetical protein
MRNPLPAILSVLALVSPAIMLVSPAKAGAQSPRAFPDAPPPPQVRDRASGARALPPGTVPLDDAQAPKAIVEERAPQPDVTTREEGGQVIQEYRIKGRLYMQRVTPKHGRPYVLVDNKGDGTFSRLDQTLDQSVRVPQWVLLEF